MKSHIINPYGVSHNTITNGKYAIVATTGGLLTAHQLEAARRVLSRALKKQGKLWFRVFPDMPFTKKPSEVRMGKGKGSFQYWYVPVKKNQIIFEFTDMELPIAKELSRIASSKLPVRTKLISKENDCI